MVGATRYSVTEWEWLKVQLRLLALESSAPKFVTKFTFADQQVTHLSRDFPEALVNCLFWCETTERLLKKKATRANHLEFYDTWVRSQEQRLSEIVAIFPKLSKEFDFRKHIVYTVLHSYGMGSLPVCQYHGHIVYWRMSSDKVPE